MVDVAVTGAAGRVGTQAVAALDEHDVTPVTHEPTADLDGVVLDVRDEEAVADALAGRDVVVHLAADPSPDASWESVTETNLHGTYAVYEAAVENDLDRVVFASTNHVHQMYNVADPSRPESLVDRPRTVEPDDPFRPDSFYAVSKVAGEALGSYYALRHGIEVVNLRIGWLLTPAELAAKDGDETLARYARAMWLSPRDCRDGVRRAVEADLPANPLSVNLLSENRDRYLPVTRAMRALGYRPRDDSADVQ